MPQFVLDTADTVDMRSVPNADCLPKAKRIIPGSSMLWTFDDLDAFTQGYVEALFFTESEPGTTRADRMTTRGTVRKSWERDATEGRHKDMPGDYGFSDMAPEALAEAIEDCATFQREAAALLSEAYDRDYDAAQAGRDYWFTRNGHGVGYWDREALAAEGLGDRLSDTCRHSSVDAYIGDDGKVYLV